MVMLARVAEQLYWMGRYVERAENTARLIHVNASLVLDLPREARPPWFTLIAITGSAERFAKGGIDPGEHGVVRFIIGDEKNPSSIVQSLAAARENARTLRDVLPREGWEQINSLYLDARGQLPGGYHPMKRFDYLKHIILGAQQLTGILDGTMSHDAGYEFVRMGQNLERADMTTRIIDVRCANLTREADEALGPFENLLWMSVLKSLTGYQMYRRQKRAAVNRGDVLDFLLQDKQFPRSMGRCLRAVQESLNNLPRPMEALAQVKTLQRLLDDCQPDAMNQAQLHEFIDLLQIHLGRLHDAIRQRYFQVSDLGIQSAPIFQKQAA